MMQEGEAAVRGMAAFFRKKRMENFVVKLGNL